MTTSAAPSTAIQREKAIKRWKRQWKVDLICKRNPHRRDLYEDIMTAL